MEPATRVLRDRYRRLSERGPGAAIASSVVLHLVLVAAVLIGPRLFANDPPQFFEYVEIISVPAARLARAEEPAPAAPPEPEEPTQPEPEEEAPEDIPAPPDDDPSEEEPVPRPDDRSAENRREEAKELPEERTAASTGNDSTELAAFDDPEFARRYSYYIEQMRRRIRQSWRRPRAPEGVELALNFRVQKDGGLTALSIRQPSGHVAFDRAGLEAVRRSSPLPPLPQSYRKDSLGVTVVFH